MEKKPNALIALFREQPVLVIVSIIVAVLFILVLVFVNNRQNIDETIGDQASPTSSAFLLYKGQTFLPTTNNISNEMIRVDLAYLARTNFKEYDPNKNPGVIFNIDSFTAIEDGKLSFTGSYEKKAGMITVDVSLLTNDIAQVKITSADKQLVDTKLPSSSKRNLLIASLPKDTETYSLAYSSASDTFIVTVFSTDEAVVQTAKNQLKTDLGDEYSEDDISIYYPAYLKGDPAYDNPQQQYVPEEEYGDGGEPINN
jgi:hypothetical protein